MGVQFKIPYAGSDHFNAYYDRARKRKPTPPVISLLPRPKPKSPPPPPPPTSPLSSIPNMTPSMRKIAERVCIKHGIFISDLISPTRDHKIVHARRDYVVRVRDGLNKSFPQIGRSIGQDHTTALHGYHSAKADPSKSAPWTPVRTPTRAKTKKPPPLTPFQEQVYALMQDGLSNTEIAIKLNRTKKQATNDRYYVNEKLRRRENA